METPREHAVKHFRIPDEIGYPLMFAGTNHPILPAAETVAETAQWALRRGLYDVAAVLVELAQLLASREADDWLTRAAAGGEQGLVRVPKLGATREERPRTTQRWFEIPHAFEPPAPDAPQQGDCAYRYLAGLADEVKPNVPWNGVKCGRAFGHEIHATEGVVTLALRQRCDAQRDGRVCRLDQGHTGEHTTSTRDGEQMAWGDQEPTS